MQFITVKNDELLTIDPGTETVTSKHKNNLKSGITGTRIGCQEWEINLQ